MREVEIKFRISDEPALIARLADLGCQLNPVVEQDDQIFSGEPLSDGSRCVLRIRTTTAGSILTLKKDITNELDCLEVETPVGNADSTKRLLIELGYQLSVRVRKSRRQGKWCDWTVCVDHVDHLGSFIEVEAMFEDGEHANQDELCREVLERLGLPDLERVTQGYDTLMKQTGQVYIEDKE